MSDGEESRGVIERRVGISAVAVLIASCLLILLPFISAALWAAILCFTTWPLFARLKAGLGGRGTWAALIATLILSAIIIAPVAILVSKLSANMDDLMAASRQLIHEGPPAPPSWVASVPLVGGRVAARWTQLSESGTDWLAELTKWLPTIKDALLGSGRALGKGVVQMLLSLVMVFILYRSGEAAADRLIFTIGRVGGTQGERLLDIAGTTIRAVVYGVLGTALLQGILAGDGYMIAGIPGAAVLGFLTFVVAVIPFGPGLVGLPAAFWLYHSGRLEAAIVLLVWVAIVGNLDNVVRPLLISRSGGDMPLILVIFGVLGGAMAFGLIGLFLGPTLLAVGYRMFDEWFSGSLKSEMNLNTSAS